MRAVGRVANDMTKALDYLRKLADNPQVEMTGRTLARIRAQDLEQWLAKLKQAIDDDDLSSVDEATAFYARGDEGNG